MFLDLLYISPSASASPKSYSSSSTSYIPPPQSRSSYIPPHQHPPPIQHHISLLISITILYSLSSSYSPPLAATLLRYFKTTIQFIFAKIRLHFAGHFPCVIWMLQHVLLKQGLVIGWKFSNSYVKGGITKPWTLLIINKKLWTSFGILCVWLY